MSDVRLVTPQFVFAFLSSFFFGTTFALFIHLPAFLEGLGATEVTIGTILGVGSIASLASRGLIGSALDRLGRKPIIMTGHVINIVSILAYLLVRDLGPYVYMAAIVRSLAEALLFTSMATIAADVVPVQRRTEGLALFGVSGQAPLALGGVLGDVILSRSDFDTLFWVTAVIAFFGLLAAAPLIEARPDHDTEGRHGVVGALVSRRLRPFWMVSLVFATALTGLFVFLKTYVGELGFGSVGLFLASYSGTAIVLRLVGAKLPARVGDVRLLRISLVVMAVGFGVLASATDAAWIVASGILGGIGHGYAFPIISSAIVTRSHHRDRGATISVFVAFFPFATVVGGPALGWLIERFGYSAMYGLLAFVITVAAILVGPWERRTERSIAASASV